ncbi:hypothetical protein ACFU9Y_31445 [Streptomyces sp. NPDC057621]|uniref:hypothetical protein n=1 Tax=Streptomyces sp. NPDC057621 TaxID=3346186 RepID=UPI0036741E48
MSGRHRLRESTVPAESDSGRDPGSWSAFSPKSETGDSSNRPEAGDAGGRSDGLLGAFWERLGDSRATAVAAAAAGFVLLGSLLITSMITDGISFNSDDGSSAGTSVPVGDPSDTSTETYIPNQPHLPERPVPSDESTPTAEESATFPSHPADPPQRTAAPPVTDDEDEDGDGDEDEDHDDYGDDDDDEEEDEDD